MVPVSLSVWVCPMAIVGGGTPFSGIWRQHWGPTLRMLSAPGDTESGFPPTLSANYSLWSILNMPSPVCSMSREKSGGRGSPRGNGS